VATTVALAGESSRSDISPLVGRPAIWGLAVDGAAGVTAVLELLRAELERDLTLCGRGRVADIDRSFVTSIPGLP
jgi:4-hydroxymandelate oxidase